jgi:hypothetical protein
MNINYDGINFNQTKDGYWVATIDARIKSLHVYIWEKHNQCRVPRGYVIHHKDEDKDNNNITNLQLMTCNDHNRLHMTGNQYWKGKHHTDETKALISKANSGSNNGRYGIKEDPEHAKERGRISGLAKMKPITQEMIDDINNGMTRKAWCEKYNCSRTLWDRVRKTL